MATSGLVSVVIPAYNVADCIGKAIDSVLRQSYSQFEILVVNDGSTDNTLFVLSEYDTQVSVLNKVNGGLSSARNHGIRHANGEFIAFLDADDYWLEDKLASQVQALNKEADVGFCSTRTRIEKPDGTQLKDWCCPSITGDLLEEIFLQNGLIPGSGSAVLVRSECLRIAGVFDENLKSLEDVDMWMRLAGITDYACVDAVLTVVVKQDISMSTNREVMREAAKMVMMKNRPLLQVHRQGRFWRCAYGRMLTDYAKWAYRDGEKCTALYDLVRALFLSPLCCGRLSVSLMMAILMGREI